MTIYALRPVMGVFNNLVMYDQHVKQNSMASIVPDLASSWSWDEDSTRLTFKLHEGIKWHDGQPFTAKDVKCTWDLLQGKASDKLRINPRKAWYRNLDEVMTNGDFEVTFRLKRPQPAFLALLASGFSPVYPCHVSPRDMLRNCLPALKNAVCFSATWTLLPGRGLRPMRAARCFTGNAPKPRSSMRSSRASAAAI